jgi:hypothetical protein
LLLVPTVELKSVFSKSRVVDVVTTVAYRYVSRNMEQGIVAYFAPYFSVIFIVNVDAVSG